MSEARTADDGEPVLKVETFDYGREIAIQLYCGPADGRFVFRLDSADAAVLARLIDAELAKHEWMTKAP